MLGTLNLTPTRRPPPPSRSREPRLAVAWESPREAFASSWRAAFSGPKAKGFHSGPYFREAWVRQPFPTRALLLSALLHILLIYVPFPAWKSFLSSTHPGAPNYDITWSGPTLDLPPLNPPAPTSKPAPPGEPNKPLAPVSADAFHPRQTIISAPRVPTHPRQTLIQPEAPMEPPKILPHLPNVVRWGDTGRSFKPRLQISRELLAKLRPKNPTRNLAAEMKAPELPNMERHLGELNIASNNAVSKLQLPIAPTTVPRGGPKSTGTDVAAPDLRANVAANSSVAPSDMAARPQAPSTTALVPRSGSRQAGTDVAAPDVRGDSSVQRLVAISPTPADPTTNPPVPAGNLASNASISPEGTQPGAPGGSANTAANTGAGTGSGSSGNGSNGSGPPGISISPGSSRPSPISGLGAAGTASSPPSSPPAKPESNPAPSDAEPSSSSPSPSAPSSTPSATSSSPTFANIQPGHAPEEIFGRKRIYTLHVNMPNLASVTGSWILSFVEMRQVDGPPGRATSGDLTGPVPLRKVDPKYPNSMIKARVEGEVVLYAVIRRDGTVDSIQLVKGVEPELDENAMQALARWRFRPAERAGAPVELESIVHIPFRISARED